jgi:hypothetical protein
MKIERAESKFEPVVITLESQEEVDILFELTSHVGGSGPVRAIVNQLWTMLENSASVTGLEGEIKYFVEGETISCVNTKI